MRIILGEAAPRPGWLQEIADLIEQRKADRGTWRESPASREQWHLQQLPNREGNFLNKEFLARMPQDRR